MSDNEYAATEIMGWCVSSVNDACWVQVKDGMRQVVQGPDWHPDSNRDQLAMVIRSLDPALLELLDHDGLVSGNVWRDLWECSMNDPHIALAAICKAHKEASK